MKIDASQPILIVEDSDDDYEATMRALKKTNNLANPVLRCETGQEAIDYMFSRGKYNVQDFVKPGIILLDLNLPGINGREVLKILKNDEHFKDIPVIVLTTSSDEKDIEDCYQDGANTYIVKPVNMDKFVLAIARLKEYWFQVAVLPKNGY